MFEGARTMNKEYMPLYVIYYHDQGKFEPYQNVCGITSFWMNKKDAKKYLKSITNYPEHYEIVEYVKK
jgi:hypothetical protein